MTKKPLLEIKNVSKLFFGNKVLNNVNFTLFPNEVHAMIGENGAGKSTLVKIIMGEYQKDEGEVLLDGVPVNFLNPAEALGKGVAMVHQELNPLLDMTVMDNLFLGREVSKFGVIDQKEQRRQTIEFLARLGLDIDPYKRMRELSIAQMQMVELCKIISLGARVIILDEPTSAIMENEAQALFDVIRKLKKQDVAIIYISHKLDELFEIADRVTVLRDGEVIESCDLSATCKEELIRAMVGRKITEFYPEKGANSGEIILSVRNATRKEEFFDVNLDLLQGEILGIAGLVGAGRTELVSAIFGARRMHKGKIFIKGKEAQISKTEDAVRYKIALITEDRKLTGLNLKGSVEDNLLLICGKETFNHGILNSKKADVIVGEIIGKLSIKVRSKDQGVKYLSGGNQQKVVLGKWLLCDPDILIFDEPTRGIDVGAKSEIYRMMRLLTASGKSIIMISSEMPELLGMSDRVIVLHEGMIAGELKKDEITQEAIMFFASGEERIEEPK